MATQTDKAAVLGKLQEWLQLVDQHRVDRAAKLELGRGPCTGGKAPLLLWCSECSADSGDAALGDPCKKSDCDGVYEYTYDPKKWAGLHDWDGGECWRCAALDPEIHEGGENFAIASSGEPAAEVSESMVRDIVSLLEGNREN